jgi:transposase InsO family protein
VIEDRRWTIYRRHGQTTPSFPVNSLMTWKWPVVNRQVQDPPALQDVSGDCGYRWVKIKI